MKCRYPFDTRKYEVNISNPIGDFAHKNYPESKYAVDFVLPLGIPVLTVRKGFVFMAKYDSDVHYFSTEVKGLTETKRKELAKEYTNLVCIDYNGIFVEYCHLAKDKVVSKK